MSRILAIDPGPVESAYALIDANTRKPILTAKHDNRQIAEWLAGPELISPCTVAIEMVASYGMPVGAEVFETCVWIGRFAERSPVTPQLIYRRKVKLHHCNSAKAKDANIVQALVDRFAPGAPNKGKGTKREPGYFHGFTADIWQAYALAVYVADRDAAVNLTPTGMAL
jgi:hypothetical protein